MDTWDNLLVKGNERLIIIPDVHGRDFWRETVKENPDGRFIFLGDYLDPYDWEGYTEDDAFRGLQDIVRFKEAHPDRVTLLWGNHDLHYLYPEMMASRYDVEHAERNAHYFWEHQKSFQLAYEVEAAGKRFLFSHAGIGRKWLKNNFPALKEEDITAELMNDLVGYPEFMASLGDVSKLRGGDKEYGSMVWADVMELTNEENQIPDTFQVFGHTMMDDPFNYDDKSYCLDCRRVFYLNMNDGCIYGANEEGMDDEG